MTDQTAQVGSTGPVPVVNKLYFAAWRWHFYAGLYVIPFMLMLSLTGLVMLWFSTVQPEYGDKIALAPAATAMSLPDQEAAAIASVPGGQGISEYITPRAADRPAMFTVVADAGKTVVALNPYTGEALLKTPKGGTWYALAEEIHGSLLIGDLGDRLIEIGASLGLLMLVTGIYLVWPRGQGGLRAMFVPRLAAKGRALWKSLHQVVGTWTSIFLLFFLISGLAWAGIWGGKFVQPWSSFPAEKWDSVPLSDQTHASLNGEGEKVVPWGLELTPMPQSGSAAGVAVLPEGAVLNLSSIVALGRKLGLADQGRFHVNPPGDSTSVWTLSQDSMSYDSTNPTIDRTVHIDQYTGRVLA
ncbi:MAG: PepSY domain-containing protein, partial [Rhodobacteraceae bacterium]|nr:PepSY domain-containing protein [Paracoccaceae bacterium]